MNKRVVILVLIILCIQAAAFAGDRAEFINLGFNNDTGAFLYAQYGKDESGTFLYADIFYHDLLSGEDLSVLSKSKTYPVTLSSGHDGLSALLMSLREYFDLYSLDIDHTQTGTTLYYQLPGQTTGELISFSDYKTRTVYSASIVIRPQSREPGTDAALAITLFQTLSDGTLNRFEAGSLTTPLENIYEFQLKQIIVSPQRNYAVLVFQVNEYDEDKDTTNIRYYVTSMKIE
ncbi:MAG: hypothetical protein KAQ69_05790 [Spirochaetales bacterium]|nr:hypothetical protein [Spirochaetales bacterium]